jgi:hypothetical protein
MLTKEKVRARMSSQDGVRSHVDSELVLQPSEVEVEELVMLQGASL